MPVYHSGRLSKTDRPDFNYPLRPTTPNLTVPLAPRNLIVTSPYQIGAIDIRWDNPRILSENSGLNIIGCNVYRSTDAQFGPYEKVNDTPISVLFYRDQTQEAQIFQEDVTRTLRYSIEPDGRWLVYTQQKPIITPGLNGQISDRIQDVLVEIDDGDGNFLTMPAFAVNGKIGEIQLISWPVFNNAVQQVIPPRLPTPPNGRVRVTYSYMKHQVLTVLNQRIFYKVTTVAVDPKDASKTIETPIDEVSDRSAFDIEMIDYIWREAIKRNYWILEQGGERVKIFVRKWMGEKCPSYEEKYGQGHQDCPECFPAGTDVTLFDGSKKAIETIVTGDRLLTVNGKSYDVTRTFNRMYKGPIQKIIAYGKDEFTCTPEHPIYVIRKEDSCCIRYNKKYSKNRCVPLSKWQCFRKNKTCEHRLVPTWVSAKDLKPGDYLLSPRFQGNCNTVFSEDLAFLLGLYTADGSISRGRKKIIQGVSFHLGTHEKDLINYTKDAFQRLFNYSLSISKPYKNCTTLRCSKKSFPQIFIDNCGENSHNKKLSIDLMSAPVDILKAFICGYVAGDGFKTLRGGFAFTTVSKNLASQLELILSKLNVPVSVKKFYHEEKRLEWGPGHWFYKGLVNSNYAKLFQLSFGKNSQKLVLKKQHKILNFGEFIGYPIISNSLESYEGTVYNAEVADNHTYLVNNTIVHNCIGTNILGGYNGPYDAIIAPPETERTVELGDMGLRMRYDIETWTGCYPLLNARDVVVRQNNERYIIGMVNYQGSRGATYQQHFNMSYLDQGDIRYKIPIEGARDNVPPAWDAYRQAQPTPASPVINDKPTVPAERQIRGRTVTFENISW